MVTPTSKRRATSIWLATTGSARPNWWFAADNADPLRIAEILTAAIIGVMAFDAHWPVIVEIFGAESPCNVCFWEGRERRAGGADDHHHSATNDWDDRLTSYDVFGDIHGHADALIDLLRAMDYTERGGAWRQPDRQAIFVGDLIDRGTQQLDR